MYTEYSSLGQEIDFRGKILRDTNLCVTLGAKEEWRLVFRAV